MCEIGYCSLVTFREVFFVNVVHRKPEKCGAKSCECMISVHREACYCERSEQLPVTLKSPHKKPRNLFRGNEHVQKNINQSKYSARSSLIQTLLSVLEFHQISRQSGSRTIPPVGNFDFQRFRSPCPEEIFFSWWIIQ